MSSSHPLPHPYEDEDDDGDEVIFAENEDLDSSDSTTGRTEDDEEEGESALEEEEGEEAEEGEVEEEEGGDEEAEEGEEEEEDHRADEEDMDLLSDEDDFHMPALLRRQRFQQQQSRHQTTPHAQVQHANTLSRSLACLSCKETYTKRSAGTCRECYEEASETEEALKKEIEELQARIAFLKTWVPEAMEEDCADIVLECSDGSKIRAHRAVLVSRSSVFKAMLESKMEESRTNTIKITDFPYEILRLFVHYLYTAEIYIESLDDCVVDLLALAEKYNVKQLKSVCERHMVSKLNSGNALSHFEYASLHGAKTLKQAALSTITENIQDFVGKTEYQELVNRDAKLVVEIFEHFLERKKTKNKTP